jgi:parallel beta-helix repeat protein
MTHPQPIRVARLVTILTSLALLAACDTPLLPLGDPIGEIAATSTLVGCDQAAARVVVSHDAHLDPSCVYTGGLEIVASPVVLDCRGATISDTAGTQPQGVHIHAPTDQSLTGITVRNCIVDGFLNTIRISRDGFKQLAAGDEYDHRFSDITIENNRLRNSRGSGIFVNAYVTGVTIQDNEVTGAGSVGIYLEAGSKDNVVLRNSIHGNGYGDVDPVNGVPFMLNGIEFRVLMIGREGIAVDGSRDNHIASNAIYSNAAGAIFLYKNCGEDATTQPGAWWERRYGADHNLIENNLITNEPEGIWVGSRMGENQYFMDCSDPTYETGPLRRIHRDYAANNTIRGNVLLGVTRGVRVEDDNTLVEANRFIHTDAAATAVLVGTKERTQTLGEPVRGTAIRGNDASVSGSAAPFAWVHGHEGTTFEANTSNGLSATFAEGVAAPRTPWLFVVSVWLP